MINDFPYMDIALKEAEKAADRDEVPVGAIIVCNNENKILSAQGNRTQELNDPTAHAEILAIREACNISSRLRLTDCSIYITLEPCPMCAQAISFARINYVYYGTEDTKGGGIENGANIFNKPSCHHKPECYPGIKEQESANLLRDFFQNKR